MSWHPFAARASATWWRCWRLWCMGIYQECIMVMIFVSAKTFVYFFVSGLTELVRNSSMFWLGVYLAPKHEQLFWWRRQVYILGNLYNKQRDTYKKKRERQRNALNVYDGIGYTGYKSLEMNKECIYMFSMHRSVPIKIYNPDLLSFEDYSTGLLYEVFET